MSKENEPNPLDAFLTFFVVISAMIIGSMLAGCGMDHKFKPVEVSPVVVEPITVNHIVDFDYEALLEYIEETCSTRKPKDQAACQGEKLKEFFEGLSRYFGALR